MNKIFSMLLVLGCCAGLSACAPNISTNSYNSSDIGSANTVKRGVVISKRPITINNNSGAGGLAGAATGAAAGSMIGGNSATNIIGAIGGAVVGGVAGNAIDSSINQHQGYQYIVRLNNGRTVAVVQTNEMVFSIHQRVLVIYGRNTHLEADDTSA